MQTMPKRDEIAEIIARAYDREQAAQMGEPDPWMYPDEEAEAESIACASAALAALDAAGFTVVPKELLSNALAVMRECGWHLAISAEPHGDGILEAACTEIEADFAMLAAVRE